MTAPVAGQRHNNGVAFSLGCVLSTQVEVKVTLQPTTSRSVRLGCLAVTVLSISGAPSDGRSGLSFVLIT
jgi:hypothetical protein